MITMDEASLVDRAQAGDEGAANSLFTREQRYLFNLMLQLSGDSAQADDLAQGAFLIAFRHLKAFRRESSFRTWLSRIAINHFRKEWRRKPPHVSICLDRVKVFAEDDQPEHIVIKREMQWCILHSLQQHVPKPYRMVLVLRDLQNLSYREIAEILQCSLAKVKTNLHRGRKMLRNHFLNGKCHAFAEKDYLCTCEEILEI